jgi:hypothetical protein
MRRYWILPLAVVATIAACASPEHRISQKLMDYGFDRSTATCVGDELEDRLSSRQLTTLADLVTDLSREGRDVRNMTVRELAERVRRTGDPELLAVLTRAGIGCAVLG